MLSIKQGGSKYHFLKKTKEKKKGLHKKFSQSEVSKVGEPSRYQPEGSLFNSYYTKV